MEESGYARYLRQSLVLFLLGIVLLLAAFLMFAGLGERILSGDDAGYSKLAKNILKYGYARMFDGSYLAGFSYQIGPGYAYMMNTWLGEYLIAISFALFGISNLTARLLPAIAGMLSLVVLYFLAMRITNQKATALYAVLFLGLMPLFYLLSRSANYYAFTMLFILLMVYGYWRLMEKAKEQRSRQPAQHYAEIFRKGFMREKRPRPWLLFTVAAILIFYTQIQIFFFMMLTLSVYMLVFDRRQWKAIIRPFAWIFIFTVPYFLFWFFGSSVVSSSVGSQFSVVSVVRALFALGFSFFTYFLLAFPMILVLFLPKLLFRQKADQHNWVLSGKSRKSLFWKCIAYIKSYITGTPGTLLQPRGPVHRGYALVLFIIVGIAVLNALFDNLGVPGVRRLFVPTLPFFAILLAGVTRLVQRKSMIVGFVLMLLLIFSNILHLFPLFAAPLVVPQHPSFDRETVDAYFSSALRIQSPFITYLSELSGGYVSPNDAIIGVLKQYPQARTYLTNAEYDLIHFYTGLVPVLNADNTSKVYRDLTQEDLQRQRIDFIMVRPLNQDEFESFLSAEIDLGQYERILIQQKDGAWVDFPDPINRRTSTDLDGTITVFRHRVLVAG